MKARWFLAGEAGGVFWCTALSVLSSTMRIMLLTRSTALWLSLMSVNALRCECCGKGGW